MTMSMKPLDEETNLRRRKITGRATLIFLSVMFLLTFFSKTINNFTLPKVTYETPSRGALIKEVIDTGNVQANTIHDLYVRTNMRVTGVMVAVGDKVYQGQTLLTLDTTTIENQLKDEQDRYLQKKMHLEKLIATGEKLKEVNLPENLLSFDRAIQTARQNLDKAQRSYDDKEVLYQVGGISPNDVADAKMNLESARMDYEVAKSNKDKAIRDNIRDIENNYRDIESTKLDIAIAERKIAELVKEINMGVVVAPCDGIVTELYFSVGMTANTSQPLYKISDINGGFQFVANVNSTAAEYLEIGDTAQISLNSFGGRTIQGKVSQVKDNPQQIGIRKNVIIDIPSDGLVGGELGTANIRKNIGSFNILVSNSAVGQDSGGNFVYILKERKGPLGNEFYVEKVSVSIGDSDNIKTAVLSGINSREHVVSNSDKPISDGSRVMPVN